MNAAALNKLGLHLRLVALPAFALLVMAVALGGFAFAFDPRLQRLVPLASWPLHAKALHYFAPWLALSCAFCTGGLCANSLGSWVFDYFTSHQAKIAVLLLAIISILLAWSVPIDIAAEHLRLTS